jgi:hypothetical protein
MIHRVANAAVMYMKLKAGHAQLFVSRRIPSEKRQVAAVKTGSRPSR